MTYELLKVRDALKVREMFLIDDMGKDAKRLTGHLERIDEIRTLMMIVATVADLGEGE